MTYAYGYRTEHWTEDPKQLTVEQQYQLLGVEPFTAEGSLFEVISYDNGAFFCNISAFRSSYCVNYIPKGCFYPLIQPVAEPEISGWTYDTLCGEQVYIVPGGPIKYPVLPYSSIIYETDIAYIIVTVSGEGDNGQLQMIADDIDFTCFR